MKKRNLINFDLTKLVCALLVVCIHASPVAGASAGIQFYVTDVAARIAVPLFYAMSGYLFFGRLEYENGRIKSCPENRTRLLRQTRRTGVLYLGWSAAYLLILQLPNWYRTGWWGTYVIKDYLVSLFFRCSYYHLWYLLAMLYAVPVLYGLLSLVPVRRAATAAALLWIFECLTYSYLWIGVDRIAPVMLIGTKMPIVYDTLLRAVPLLFLGAYLSQHPPAGKPRLWAVLAAAVLCAGEATALYLRDPGSGQYSYLFLTPLAAYLQLRALLLSRPVRLRPGVGVRMRSLSTNVYLIHPMVIALLAPLSIPDGPTHYGAVVTVSVLLSLLLDAGTAGLCQCTKQLRSNRSALFGK